MPDTPKLLGVPQVAFTVKDITAGVKFYNQTLGLPILLEAPNIAILGCGDTRVLLGTPEQNASDQRTFAYFRVADIHAAVARLKASRVKVDEEPHMVGRFQDREVWLAKFTDPDGTILHLTSEVQAVQAKPTPITQGLRSS